MCGNTQKGYAADQNNNFWKKKREILVEKCHFGHAVRVCIASKQKMEKKIVWFSFSYGQMKRELAEMRYMEGALEWQTSRAEKQT